MTAKHPVAGKRVLITGAARGIGANTAAELARRGARLSLAAPVARLTKRRVATDLAQLDTENQARGATWH